jgi:hypothetical protein
MDGCPNSWAITIPNLVVEEYSANYNGVDVSYFESNFAGPDSSSNDQRGLIGSANAKNPSGISFSLSRINPTLYEKLSQLGVNVVWNSSYEIVGKKSSSIYSSKESFRNLFTYPVRPWRLYQLGLSNNSQIVWKLNISVKGCSEFTLTSNLATLNISKKSGINQDQYFDILPKFSYPKFDFKQQEAIYQALKINKELISTSPGNTNIPLSRTGYQELGGIEFSYLLLGINPPGCIDSINPNSIPPVNPVSVQINESNCQVGVFAPIQLSKSVKCTSCELSEKYKELISRLSNDFRTDDWSYDLVLVDSFFASGGTQSATQKPKAKTITCVKGKLIKKVTAVKPMCPAGYKKKV